MMDEVSKLKEIFTMLYRGIEVIHYESDWQTGKTTSTSKALWMEAELYRLCCDKERPNIKMRAKGIIPCGIYLRDVADIREGLDAFPFLNADTKPSNPDSCFSLVGSERTISLELPKGSRDWLLTRLRLITEEILVDDERKNRKYKIWENMNLLNNEERKQAENMAALLERGIELTQHDATGEIRPGSLLTFDKIAKRFAIRKTYTTMMGFWTKLFEQTLDIGDVSEIRRGSQSWVFVRTESTNMDDVTLAIIGSKATLNIQMATKPERDELTERLFVFVMLYIRPPSVPIRLLPSHDDENSFIPLYPSASLRIPPHPSPSLPIPPHPS